MRRGSEKGYGAGVEAPVRQKESERRAKGTHSQAKHNGEKKYEGRESRDVLVTAEGEKNNSGGISASRKGRKKNVNNLHRAYFKTKKRITGERPGVRSL